MRAVSRIHPSLGIYRKHSESFGALKGKGGKSHGFAVLTDLSVLAVIS
jgi:hypothetical protein